MKRVGAFELVVIAFALHAVGCADSDTLGRPTGAAGAGGAVGTGGAAPGRGGASGGGAVGVAGGVGTGMAGDGGKGGGGAGTSGAAGGARGGSTGASGGSAGAAGAGTGGSGACDPFSNAGCAAGTKCTVLQTPTSFALGCGSKGAKAAGATCTQAASGQMQTGDDCADGMACIALQGETTPTCRQFCTASGGATACPAKMTCSLQITNLPGTSFCRSSPSCTLLTQSGCPTGQACYLVPTGATCGSAGHAAPGTTCASANDCAPGSTCITTNGVSTCASFCSLPGGTPACAATSSGGATCTAPPGTPPEPATGICR